MKEGVILLTGCTGVLGSAFVERYKQRFDIVGIARRNPPTVPDGYHFLKADITTDIDHIVHRVLERFTTIDLLINNAVYYNMKSFDAIDQEVMTLEYRTNVIAPVALANHLLKKCWKIADPNKNRSIVNVSSSASVNNYFGVRQGSYASTKAALNTISVHQASDYQPYGIRVNAVAPTSFPYYVSTESVCETIMELHQSDLNGQVKVLDEGKQYFL